MRNRLLLVPLFAAFSCYAMEELGQMAMPADTGVDIDLLNYDSAQALLRLLDINADGQDQHLLGVVNTTLSFIDKSKYSVIYSKIKARGFDRHKDNRITLLKELLLQVNEINKTQQDQNQKLDGIKKKLEKKVSNRNTALMVTCVTTAGGIVGTIIAAVWGTASC